MKLRRADVHGGLCAALLTLVALTAEAQSDSGGQARSGLRFDPRLSVSETYTDNLKLSSVNRDAALITSISPGLSVSAGSGRLRGSLDYSLNGLIYSQSRESGRLQNNLAAKASLDVVDNWFSVDARASISQQTISAFGQNSSDPTLANRNVSELYSLGVSPVMRGALGGIARYEIRADFNELRAKDSPTGDVSTRGLSLQLSSPRAGTLLGWAANLSQQRWEPKGGRATENTSATGSLLWRPDPEWDASLTAGKERNSFTTLSQQSGDTYGVQAGWRPSMRTRLAFDWSRHDYGNSHSFSFEHRMARSVWRISDTQSASAGGAQGGSSPSLSNYDLFYAMFASREPDPQKRDLLVREFLAALGLNPNSIAVTGFMNSSASLTRRQEASMALQGVRSTLTFVHSRTRSSRLDPVSVGRDDFADTNQIRTRLYSVNLGHRLTPDSSLSISLSQQRSQGDRTSQRSDLKSLLANWTTRLGPKSNLTLGLRRNEFDSPTDPYRENAVLATFVQQF